jgi:predicted RND superfamily exporter protein
VLPYAKPETGYARINARVTESGPRFSREQLIEEIEGYAKEQLELEERDVIVTGMMVLFNDMLAQLAESQMRTLQYVVLATFLMFALLLRSPVLAILALIPNVIAAATVISFMGYTEIPMDMMTITIAAISIGIGVDDAIHYLHRFREALSERGDVEAAVREAHATIGHAMYYTSVIIIAGFSILAFSNFLPTVYFGLLTALAMALALLANLTVLPSLLLRFYRLRLS